MTTTIVPVDPLDSRNDARFAGVVATLAASDRAVWGDAGTAWSADEIRELQRSTAQRRTSCAALDESGAVVGAVTTIEPLRENTHSSGLWLGVHPDHWRQGVGSALLEHAERGLRERGRTLVADHSGSPSESGEPAFSFATKHGYTPTQEGLRSDLDLPLPRDDARRLTGVATDPAYVIETAWDDLPPEWLEDRAHLARRMSTDAPMGALELDEEEWDADRVRQVWARGRASGRRLGEAVARHRASGRLVGYTDLAVSASTPELAYQLDTLVLREHRGHGLGLSLKLAALSSLRTTLPQVRTVRTWNARSNEPMLRVNAEMGFEVRGHFIEWQKHLT